MRDGDISDSDSEGSDWGADSDGGVGPYMDAVVSEPFDETLLENSDQMMIQSRVQGIALPFNPFPQQSTPTLPTNTSPSPICLPCNSNDEDDEQDGDEQIEAEVVNEGDTEEQENDDTDHHLTIATVTKLTVKKLKEYLELFNLKKIGKNKGELQCRLIDYIDKHNHQSPNVPLPTLQQNQHSQQQQQILPQQSTVQYQHQQKLEMQTPEAPQDINHQQPTLQQDDPPTAQQPHLMLLNADLVLAMNVETLKLHLELRGL